MEYNIILETYEGPMDLLLDLIKKNEIDIYDIPISIITKKFLDYIKMAEVINLELTSDFVLMASTLLEIKSKMLLPKKKIEEDDEDIDPRDELVQKLLEYEKFKNASEILKEKESFEKGAIYRLREEITFENDLECLKNIEIDEISKTFINIIKNYEKKEETFKVYRENFSIEDASFNIKKKLINTPRFLFSELLIEVTKIDIITYFLAILELIKLDYIRAVQKNDFQDILIKLRNVK